MGLFDGNYGYNMGGGQSSGGGQQSGGGGNWLSNMNPLLGSSLLNMGGSLLGGLAGLFRGPSQSQKSSRQVFNLAQNRLGQSVMDPQQYLAQYMRSLAPKFNQQAEGVSKRLGLDSGVAQGEMMRFQQPMLSGLLADLNKFNAQMSTQRDMDLFNIMSQSAQNS